MRDDPIGSSALALEALALGDIDDQLSLAFPAVDLEMLCPGFWPYPLQLTGPAVGTSQIPVLDC